MSKLIYPIEGVYTEETVDVSVVIPLYKSSAVVQEQIQRWVTDTDLKVEVVYVDDRCPQHSKNAVFQAWNKRRDRKKHLVKLVLSETNLGFGGACNLGSYYAHGKYLIFLNADTIVTPNWICPMIELLEKDDIGLVGNLQLKDGGEWNGSIDGAGSEWTWQHMNFFHLGRHIYRGELLERPYYPHNAPKDLLEIGEREMVTGCCMAIRANLFKNIGGFNPRYRIGYWEDSEICLTLKEQGYKIMFQPESVIYHKLHHSGAGEHPFTQLNRNYFYNKWIATQRIDRFVKAKRNIKAVKISSILVRREAAHGDVLLAAAILPAIRKQYPDAKIYFATATVCADVLKNNPYIDHIISESEIHSHIYQLIYNLDIAYERRPHTNILQAYADEAGVSITDCEVFIDKELDIELPSKFVAIHAGKTAWAGRNWISDRFDEISNRLHANGYAVVCMGSSGDHLIPCDLDIRGKTTIQQLAGVLSQSRAFVGIDSLPMHIAQTVNLPGVCFFGCIKPYTRIIQKNMIGVTAKDLKCLGCHQCELRPKIDMSQCPNGTLDCEKLVSVEHMWEKTQEILCYQNA